MYQDMIPYLSMAIAAAFILKIYSIHSLYKKEARLRERIETRKSRQIFITTSELPVVQTSGPSDQHIISYVESLINPIEEEIIYVEDSDPVVAFPTAKTYPTSPPVLTHRIDTSNVVDISQAEGFKSKSVVI